MCVCFIVKIFTGVCYCKRTAGREKRNELQKKEESEEEEEGEDLFSFPSSALCFASFFVCLKCVCVFAAHLSLLLISSSFRRAFKRGGLSLCEQLSRKRLIQHETFTFTARKGRAAESRPSTPDADVNFLVF